MSAPGSPSEESVRGTAAVRVAPKRLYLAAAGAGVAAMGLGAAANVTHAGVLQALYALSLAATAVAMMAAVRANMRPPDWGSAVSMEAGPEGISLDGQRRATRDELTLGTITPRTGYAMVTLTRRDGGKVEFMVQSVEQARSVLQALELGADDKAITRKVMSPMIQLKVTLPLVFVAMPASIALASVLPNPLRGLLGLLGFVGPIAAIYVFGLIKTRVTVGADGVLVRWLGSSSFTPLADISRVERAGTAGRMRVVRLHLKAGGVKDINVALRGNNLFEPFIAEDEQALLAERIEEAMALASAAHRPSVGAWVAQRGAQDVLSWAEELRLNARLAQKIPESGLHAEKLWAVLYASAEHASARAAAAVALSALLDEAGRKKLGDFAESVVDPRLRAVLAALLAGDTKALRDPLTALEADQRTRVRVSEDAALMAEAESEVAAELSGEALAEKIEGKTDAKS